MIPFEGVLPYAIMATLLTLGPAAAGYFKIIENNGHNPRHSVDYWENQMIERDFRLTGKFREQAANDKAPEAFKTNGYWKLEKPSRWW